MTYGTILGLYYLLPLNGAEMTVDPRVRCVGIRVEPSGQCCGAHVTGVDLSAPAADGMVAEIRAAWLEHHVLAFPDQALERRRPGTVHAVLRPVR